MIGVMSASVREVCNPACTDLLLNSGHKPTQGQSYLFYGFYQSRLNVLGGPGPARLMGPLSSLWPTWRGGAVVLCTSESGNTHLGFNQGQT